MPKLPPNLDLRELATLFFALHEWERPAPEERAFERPGKEDVKLLDHDETELLKFKLREMIL